MPWTDNENQQGSDLSCCCCCTCVCSYATRAGGGFMSYNLQPSMDAEAATSYRAKSSVQRRGRRGYCFDYTPMWRQTKTLHLCWMCERCFTHNSLCKWHTTKLRFQTKWEQLIVFHTSPLPRRQPAESAISSSSSTAAVMQWLTVMKWLRAAKLTHLLLQLITEHTGQAVETPQQSLRGNRF